MNTQSILMTALNSLPDAVLIVDAQGRFVEFNEAFISFHRFRERESCPSTIGEYAERFELFLPTGEAAIFEDWAISRALRGEAGANVEFTLRRKNTGESWIAISCFAPLRDAKGGIVGAVVTMRDLSTSGAVESRLRESEQRYRELFAANPHPMWVYDLETLAFLDVNDAAIHSYGYSRDEFLGMTIMDIRPCEDAQRLIENVSQVREGFDAAGLWRHRTKDGRLMEVEISSHTMRFAGRPAELVMAHDMTARIEAERKSVMHQLLLESIVQYLPAGVCVMRESDLRIVLINPAYQTFAPGKDMIGKTWAELWPETGQDFDAICRRVLETGYPHVVNDEPNQVRRAQDGSLETAYFSWSLHRVALAGTQEHVLLGTALETTDRIKAVHALKEREEHLRLSVEAAHIGTFDWEIAHDRITWSRWHEELWGFKPGEFGGNYASFASRLHPDDLDEVNAEVAQCIQNRCPFSREFRVLWPDGDVRWISALGEFAFNPDGTAARMRGVVMDISQKKQSETELNQSQQQLSVAVRVGQVGLWSWDIRQDRCIYSDEWCRQLGCTREQLSGTIEDWFRRLHPDDLPRIQAMRNHLDELAEDSFTHEYRILNAVGDYRWHLGSVSVVRDPRGSVTGLSGANLDITERRKLEEDLRQAQKMESIGRLAGGVAHDFNNLLSVIGGYTQMALDTLPESQPMHKDLEHVKRAAERAANLTRQLLAFSRRQVLRPEMVDLNRVIRDSEKMLKRLVGEDIEFSTSLTEPMTPVLVDPGQLEQVLMNLVINARDAMPYGGPLKICTLTVQLEESESSNLKLKPGIYASMSVQDGGAGINPRDLQHIFEPFFTTKEQGKGTGLGLSTVYGIVRQSGGVITVDSQVGLGSTFAVYLPCVTETKAIVQGRRI